MPKCINIYWEVYQIKTKDWNSKLLLLIDVSIVRSGWNLVWIYIKWFDKICPMLYFNKIIKSNIEGLSFYLKAGRMWLVKGFTFNEVNIISVVKRNGNIVDITTLEDMLLAGS